LWLILGSAFEAPAVVTGLDDIAVVVRRSRSAVVIFMSANTLGHSPKAKLAVGKTVK